MFGIPMLYNNIPGLVYSVGSFKAGEAVELSDKESVLKAIRKIDENYEVYKQASESFYVSCNIGNTIDCIIKKYEEGNITHC